LEFWSLEFGIYTFLMLPLSFFQQNCLELAPALLGCELVHNDPRGFTSGIIVETEAYREDDEASHSFRGPTPRNEVMFGPGGHAYIYFTYGIHYCFNIVAGHEDYGEGVLIRALKPTGGLELMRQRRQTEDDLNLCSGPAKLVQALSISRMQNGAALNTHVLHLRPRLTEPTIALSPRIGIKKAVDKPWRYFLANSPFVSGPKAGRIV
jgi:DNA-3-methyladenine glycosylase